MTAAKRFLESRPARVLFALLMRVWRFTHFGGTLYRHDPAFLALMRTRDPVILACWHQDFLFTMGYLSRWNPR
ncbi:MAG: hypothetical protein ACYTG6_13810, partial [Planctomycetota bacterium]